MYKLTKWCANNHYIRIKYHLMNINLNLFYDKVERNPALQGFDFESHVIAEVVDGLWKLHAWGILQDDPFLSNVVIGKDGHCFWIDFEKSRFLVNNFLALLT